MASNEDEASELSHAHDGLIQRFEMNHPSVKYTCEICYIELDAEIEIMIELYTDENRNQRVAVFRDPLSNPAEWERLGNAIGRCSTIYEVELRKVQVEIDQIDALNPEVYQCIETLYRGLESNSSIENLDLDMDLFPSSGVFPTFNLNGAQFKENLKHLTLSGFIPIGINQSLMILPLLESTSLESFCIPERDFLANEAAIFSRIISACTRVQRLDMNCKDLNTNEGATSVAMLFRDQRSILTQFGFNFYGNICAENLHIIVDGLTSNTTIKALYCEVDSNEFERLLCNTSSIEAIHNSDHTLQQIEPYPCPFLKDYLELNKDTNKDKVIRTKIARYYFRGEFDISPFFKMNIKLVPQVMAMIEGDGISQSDAIYRLLRNIPDLCAFPSGVSRKRKNDIL
eukprot:scaffold50774_cov22-Cyclotella_meneghiniana.AAC.1